MSSSEPTGVYFLIGVNTCISVGCTPYLLGNLVVTKDIISSLIESISPFVIKKKLLFGFLLETFIGFPLLIACALSIISLSSACLNISVRQTVGIILDSMQSARTLPGPIAGNWSASPTKINFVPGVIASSRLFINNIFTIEISSIMITSYGSGLSSL